MNNYGAGRNGGGNKGLIIGLVAGIVVLFAAIVVLVVLLLLKGASDGGGSASTETTSGYVKTGTVLENGGTTTVEADKVTTVEPDGQGGIATVETDGQGETTTVEQDVTTEPYNQHNTDNPDQSGSSAYDYFLGTWNCTNDEYSTVVISRANEQAGGFFVDFFFHRIAYATGYANKTEDGLSINQGQSDRYAEGTERYASVKGELVRTANGFTYTITESEDEYLRVGDAYEYVRGTDGTYGLTGTLLGNWESADWAGADIRLFTFSADGTWTGEHADYAGNSDCANVSGTYEIRESDNEVASFRMYDENGNTFKEGFIWHSEGDYGLQFDHEDPVYYRF